MKKAVLFILLIGISISSFSQENANKQYKPIEGDYGLTFSLTGLINNIALSNVKDELHNDAFLLRHYLKDDLALRFGFGLKSLNHKFSTFDSVGTAQVQFDSTFKRTDIYFAPGVEKHLVGSEKLDPYMGAQLVLGNIGRSKMNGTRSVTDTIGIDKLNIVAERDGGFAVGLNLIAGFNYFFTPRLSIGAEYVVGFINNRTGGDWTTVTIDTPKSGSGSTRRQQGTDIITENVLKVSSTAGITLSYFFARKKS